MPWYEVITMSEEKKRKRVVREATHDEKERHRQIRDQVKQDLPELRAWAHLAAARD